MQIENQQQYTRCVKSTQEFNMIIMLTTVMMMMAIAMAAWPDAITTQQHSK